MPVTFTPLSFLLLKIYTTFLFFTFHFCMHHMTGHVHSNHLPHRPHVSMVIKQKHVIMSCILFAGYMNLSNGSAAGDVPGAMSVSKEEIALVTPRCWKTVYYLLDLYATMPETKTVAHRYNSCFFLFFFS